MKRSQFVAISLTCAICVLTTAGCHKKKKHAADAGVADAGDVVALDGGTGKAMDGGVANVDGGGANAATNAVPAEKVSRILLSGTISRDAAGIAKVGVQLSPAAPGQNAAPPGAQSTTQLVITRAGAPQTTISLPTSFDIQGIKGMGPIANGTSGNIEPTVVEIPSDAIKLAIVSDGVEAFSLAKKPTQTEVKIVDPVAKPGAGAVDVSFKAEPKSPLSWILYVDKGKGDWSQVASGDDTKTTAVVPADSLPGADPVHLRLDATDGFDVASVALSAKRPDVAPPATGPADAGSIIAKEDAGG